MEDREIIALFWARSETALGAVAEKYGAFCSAIALSILREPDIAQECVNDTYLQAWNSIPPGRPESLPAFLGKITRNLALNRYKHEHALKRGGTQTDLALEELEGSVIGSRDLEETVDFHLLTETINKFLAEESSRNRNIFLRRYFLLAPIREIAEAEGVSEEKIKSILFRMRKKLKRILEEIEP